MTKRSKKAQRRAAARAPGTIRYIAATKWSARKQRHYNSRRLGRFGAASDVRTVAIDDNAAADNGRDQPDTKDPTE